MDYRGSYAGCFLLDGPLRARELAVSLSKGGLQAFERYTNTKAGEIEKLNKKVEKKRSMHVIQAQNKSHEKKLNSV